MVFLVIVNRSISKSTRMIILRKFQMETFKFVPRNANVTIVLSKILFKIIFEKFKIPTEDLLSIKDDLGISDIKYGILYCLFYRSGFSQIPTLREVIDLRNYWNFYVKKKFTVQPISNGEETYG